MEELTKSQYLEVTRLIDNRFNQLQDSFRHLEDENAKFLKNINTEITVLTFDLRKRVDILEKTAFAVKTWVYTITTVVSVCGAYVATQIKDIVHINQH